MAGKKGVPNTSTLQFYEYYDDLCKQYGDPLELLFEVSSDPLIDYEYRIKAAKELVAYRHAKRRAVEVVSTAEPIGINIDKDDKNL